MKSDIRWLGHDTFRIQAERVVYTDPFQLKSRDVADIILVTHEHRDHCSPEDIEKLRGPETVIVAPADCREKLGPDIVSLAVGESREIKGVLIEAVPSYNTNKKFHTHDRGWVGYIFTMNNERIYLAGDTDHIPEMKGLKVDIALLPVSGTYVMTADEAIRAALDIMPGLAIPMHYGAIVGSSDDAQRFAEGLKGKVQVKILAQE